ncbi:hypothetical protein DL765_003857 [Monosporascus sp. GIB2]|nr:hypothetical protein DL765_003857 [Monosporascus sp. GIB2]
MDGKDVHTHEALVALEAAGRAFSLWSTTKPPFRRDIFLKAADILDRRAGECKWYMVQEIGAHAHFTQFNLATAAEILRDVAGRISSALSGIVPVCQEQGTHALVVKEPYGVVLGIAPWDAPYILGIRAVAYALAAGDTCILKGSEFSPRCFWVIGSVFRDAGLRDGCLNVIYHRPEDAAEITTMLIEHPAVKKIDFTGSTVVGSIIAGTAGRNLKPVLRELGSKNNAIMCEDAHLEKAAQQCALGAFLHAGQICMSTERILVHENAIEQFTQKLKKAISATFDDVTANQALAQPAGVNKAYSVAARIETGAVHVNSMSIHDEAGLPHGGAKKSGRGRFNAQAGLDEFLGAKTITFQTEW